MNRIRLWMAGWSYQKQAVAKADFFEHQRDLGMYRQAFGEFWRVLKPNGLCILHVGVVKNFDMAKELLPFARDTGFEHLRTISEDTSKLESHGIRDRGATHTHQFLVLSRQN